MPIYIGNQKIEMSGMDKVYVGTTLVYQKTQSLVTISYRKAIYQSTLPSSIQVPVGYVLTAADLPTQTDSGTWSVTGWTLDGSTKINAGYVVTGDITLLAIHKGTWTSGDLRKTASKSDNSSGSKTLTVSVSMGNVGNATSTSTAFTYALSHSWTTPSMSSYYKVARLAAWGGLVGTIYVDNACRLEWTPTKSTITYTSSGLTLPSDQNAPACYPGVVMRHNDDGTYVWATNQNSTNKISHNVPSPHSGSTVRVYIQYGGNSGGKKLSRKGGYYSSGSSFSSSLTTSTTTTTETVYLYTL